MARALIVDAENLLKLENRRSSRLKNLDRYFGIPLALILGFFRPLFRFMAKRTSSSHRILVIKLSALGDVVTMLPALTCLKTALPHYEIHFLGGTSNETFVKMLPFISRFMNYTSLNVSELRKQKYDLVLDYDQWVRASGVFGYVSFSKNLYGFKSKNQWRHFLYDASIEFNSENHTAKNFWNLTATALKHFKTRTPEDSIEILGFEESLTKSKDWRSKILNADKSQSSSEYFVIHPGCGDHGLYREWPTERWVNFISLLKSQNPNSEIFVTGQGDHEKKLAQILSESAPCIDLVGKLQSNELLSKISGAKAVFCGNTGIMHLASFLAGNVVVINGPTSPTLWGPLWGGKLLSSPLKCAPCLTWGYDYGCDDPVCVKVTTPEQVMKVYNA